VPVTMVIPYGLRKIMVDSIATSTIAELTIIWENLQNWLDSFFTLRRHVSFQRNRSDVVSTHLDIPLRDTSAAQMPAPG